MTPNKYHGKPSRSERDQNDHHSDSDSHFSNDDQFDLQDLASNDIARKKRLSHERVHHVVFDTELTATQIRNLEQALSVDIMDRTAVIVEIFHRHAKSPAAKAQVEIARLTYLTPRMRRTGPGERQGGGIGAKGVGETKHELDKRRIRDRIAELKADLEHIHAEASLRRKRRAETMKVALVGYTNAGKSSLMRALTGSEVYVANKLFATLDTTVRTLVPETVPKILVTDTVGFIQKLPHELVASFRSTLDEALDASLLLYVVDASDPHFREQIATTKSVLKDIEADKIPYVLILNKSDKLTSEERQSLTREFPDAKFSSAIDPEDVKKLHQFISESFESRMTTKTYTIDFSNLKFRALLHEHTRIMTETSHDDHYVVEAKAIPGEFARLESMVGFKSKDLAATPLSDRSSSKKKSPSHSKSIAKTTKNSTVKSTVKSSPKSAAKSGKQS